ncbi:hypothetical protein SANTM175S_06994 [Streptomyces antimycoticus]
MGRLMGDDDAPPEVAEDLVRVGVDDHPVGGRLVTGPADLARGDVGDPAVAPSADAPNRAAIRSSSRGPRPPPSPTRARPGQAGTARSATPATASTRRPGDAQDEAVGAGRRRPCPGPTAVRTALAVHHTVVGGDVPPSVAPGEGQVLGGDDRRGVVSRQPVPEFDLCGEAAAADRRGRCNRGAHQPVGPGAQRYGGHLPDTAARPHSGRSRDPRWRGSAPLSRSRTAAAAGPAGAARPGRRAPRVARAPGRRSRPARSGGGTCPPAAGTAAPAIRPISTNPPRLDRTHLLAGFEHGSLRKIGNMSTGRSGPVPR